MTLAGRIRAALHTAARPTDAPAMAAYMQHVQPFLGVKTPARRALVRQALQHHPNRAGRLDAAADLWGDEFREARYAAQDIVAACRPTLNDLPVLEAMVPGCDHWDVLDAQIGLLGRMLAAHPEVRRERVREWRQSGHLWTRRAAILTQLHARRNTDTDLLRETIAHLLPEREFFIQKAIGWALREYAKTDAAWVQRTVRELGIGGLARREALRHVGAGEGESGDWASGAGQPQH